MKKVLLPLILFWAFASLQAEPIIDKPAEQKPFQPTVEDYKNTIEYLKKLIVNIDKEEFYPDVYYTDLKTKTVKKFVKWSSVEKDLFYIMRCETVSNQMHQLNIVWVKESAMHTNKNLVPKEEIDKFIAELSKMQTEFAVKFESLAPAIFDKHKKEIPEKEAKLYISRIKEWHDENKLIKR